MPMSIIEAFEKEFATEPAGEAPATEEKREGVAMDANPPLKNAGAPKMGNGGGNNNNADNFGDPQMMSMQEHDDKYHPGGYNGGKCSWRDARGLKGVTIEDLQQRQQGVQTSGGAASGGNGFGNPNNLSKEELAFFENMFDTLYALGEEDLANDLYKSLNENYADLEPKAHTIDGDTIEAESKTAELIAQFLEGVIKGDTGADAKTVVAALRAWKDISNKQGLSEEQQTAEAEPPQEEENQQPDDGRRSVQWEALSEGVGAALQAEQERLAQQENGTIAPDGTTDITANEDYKIIAEAIREGNAKNLNDSDWVLNSWDEIDHAMKRLPVSLLRDPRLESLFNSVNNASVRRWLFTNQRAFIGDKELLAAKNHGDASQPKETPPRGMPQEEAKPEEEQPQSASEAEPSAEPQLLSDEEYENLKALAEGDDPKAFLRALWSLDADKEVADAKQKEFFARLGEKKENLQLAQKASSEDWITDDVIQQVTAEMSAEKSPSPAEQSPEEKFKEVIDKAGSISAWTQAYNALSDEDKAAYNEAFKDADFTTDAMKRVMGLVEEPTPTPLEEDQPQSAPEAEKKPPEEKPEEKPFVSAFSKLVNNGVDSVFGDEKYRVKGTRNIYSVNGKRYRDISNYAAGSLAEAFQLFMAAFKGEEVIDRFDRMFGRWDKIKGSDAAQANRSGILMATFQNEIDELKGKAKGDALTELGFIEQLANEGKNTKQQMQAFEKFKKWKKQYGYDKGGNGNSSGLEGLTQEIVDNMNAMHENGGVILSGQSVGADGRLVEGKPYTETVRPYKLAEQLLGEPDIKDKASLANIDKISSDLLKATGGKSIKASEPSFATTQFVIEGIDVADGMKLANAKNIPFLQREIGHKISSVDYDSVNGSLTVKVENDKRGAVSTKKLFMTPEWEEAVKTMGLPLAIGEDEEGKPIIKDLASLPHLLVGGATGNGKSVAIHSIASSLMMALSPDELGLLCIDPKQTELGNYSNSPYALMPTAKSAADSVAALQWLEQEMNNRQRFLNEQQRKHPEETFRDIKDYNKWAKANGEKPLKYIVPIVDEVTSLVADKEHGAEASRVLAELGQRARAAGINLVVATQHPSQENIGKLRQNLESTLAFKTSNRYGSTALLGDDATGKGLSPHEFGGPGEFLLKEKGRLIHGMGGNLGKTDPKKIIEYWKNGGQKSTDTTGAEEADDDHKPPTPPPGGTPAEPTAAEGGTTAAPESAETGGGTSTGTSGGESEAPETPQAEEPAATEGAATSAGSGAASTAAAEGEDAQGRTARLDEKFNDLSQKIKTLQDSIDDLKIERSGTEGDKRRQIEEKLAEQQDRLRTLESDLAEIKDISSARNTTATSSNEGVENKEGGNENAAKELDPTSVEAFLRDEEQEYQNAIKTIQGNKKKLSSRERVTELRKAKERIEKIREMARNGKSLDEILNEVDPPPQPEAPANGEDGNAESIDNKEAPYTPPEDVQDYLGRLEDDMNSRLKTLKKNFKRNSTADDKRYDEKAAKIKKAYTLAKDLAEQGKSKDEIFAALQAAEKQEAEEQSNRDAPLRNSVPPTVKGQVNNGPRNPNRKTFPLNSKEKTFAEDFLSEDGRGLQFAFTDPATGQPVKESQGFIWVKHPTNGSWGRFFPGDKKKDPYVEMVTDTTNPLYKGYEQKDGKWVAKDKATLGEEVKKAKAAWEHASRGSQEEKAALHKFQDALKAYNYSRFGTDRGFGLDKTSGLRGMVNAAILDALSNMGGIFTEG